MLYYKFRDNFLKLFSNKKIKLSLYFFLILFFVVNFFGIALGIDMWGNDPSNYQVCIDCCDIPGGNSVVQPATYYTTAPTPKFIWSYKKGIEPISNVKFRRVGPGLDQDSFWIQISENINFSTLAYNHGWSPTGAWTNEPTANVYSYTIPSSASLSFNTAYYWRILIGDNEANTGCIISAGFPNVVTCPPPGSEFVNYGNYGSDPLTGIFTTEEYYPPYNLSFDSFGLTCVDPMDPSTDYWTTTLRWDYNNTDHDDFEVYVSTTGVGGWSLLGSPVNDQLAIMIDPDDTLYYRVRVINSVNSEASPYSGVLQIDSPKVCNAEVDDIVTYNCDCVTLTWPDADGAVNHYRVERRHSNHPYDLANNGVWVEISSNAISPFQDCNIVSDSYLGPIDYEYNVKTCIDASCSVFYDSYLVKNIVSPCQTLPQWEEYR